MDISANSSQGQTVQNRIQVYFYSTFKNNFDRDSLSKLLKNVNKISNIKEANMNWQDYNAQRNDKKLKICISNETEVRVFDHNAQS